MATALPLIDNSQQSPAGFPRSLERPKLQALACG